MYFSLTLPGRGLGESTIKGAAPPSPLEKPKKYEKVKLTEKGKASSSV